MKVSIVVPTKNEERSLRELLPDIKKYGDEVIVIDGHSTDNTREVAKEFGVRFVLDNAKGKGDGLRVGIKEAEGDIIVFIDSDGSHDPHDIPKLIAPIIQGKSDHVGGSRALGGSEELSGKFEYFIRWFGSAIILMGINYKFDVFLTDSQNGFRAIRTEVVRDLDLQEDITTIEQEMIIKTIKKGYRISEVPAHEFVRRYGDSRIKLSKVWFRYVYSWLKYMFI